MDKKKYMQLVNNCASFMVAYFDAAMKSGAIGDDVAERDIFAAALREHSWGFNVGDRNVRNVIACTPSPAIKPVAVVSEDLKRFVEDMIDGGRLTEADIPEDFMALTSAMNKTEAMYASQ